MSADTDHFDHGVLNLPLVKRGNIDTAIDRWKAEQARETRSAHAATFRSVREQKARVRELLARIGDHRVMLLAKPLGSRKPSTARIALARAASANLGRWLPALEREATNFSGCAACWAPAGECDHDARQWLGPSPDDAA